MMYRPTLTRPKKRKPRNPFKMVTILLPVGSKMPVIRGKWKRLPDGRIRARYTLDEYLQCLQLFELLKDTEKTL